MDPFSEIANSSEIEPDPDLDDNCTENCTSGLGVYVRHDIWVIPLIVVSTINVVVIASFELFVLYKSCRSRRRHLFLGQMLLFGLFLCSCCGFAFVPRPHWITCAVIRVALGLSYVLVFATLLVKSVFLLSLHVGVYLPTALQGLLLFFMIGVQVVIAVQWIVFRPPDIASVSTQRGSSIISCAVSSRDLVLSLVYNIFLLVVGALLSMKARRLRENHRESRYIGVATFLSILIWVAWVLVVLLADIRYRDVAMAFGVVVTASIVFLVMFLPKGRQLAAMGRDVYADERDGISSVNHSIYTPSFLHMKPNSVLLKQNTMTKQQSVSSDRDMYLYPGSRIWRYGYPSYPQMAPHDHMHPFNTDRGAQKKPNVSFGRGPLY